MADSWITKGLCPSPYGCQMLKCAWKFHCQFAFLSILLEQVGLNRVKQSPGMTFSIWPLKLMTSQSLQGAKIIAISFNWFFADRDKVAASAPFPKSRTSYFRFARFNTSALYYLRAWHRLEFEHAWAKVLIYVDHCEVVFLHATRAKTAKNSRTKLRQLLLWWTQA